MRLLKGYTFRSAVLRFFDSSAFNFVKFWVAEEGGTNGYLVQMPHAFRWIKFNKSQAATRAEICEIRAAAVTHSTLIWPPDSRNKWLLMGIMQQDRPNLPQRWQTAQNSEERLWIQNIKRPQEKKKSRYL